MTTTTTLASFADLRQLLQSIDRDLLDPDFVWPVNEDVFLDKDFAIPRSAAIAARFRAKLPAAWPNLDALCPDWVTHRRHQLLSDLAIHVQKHYAVTDAFAERLFAYAITTLAQLVVDGSGPAYYEWEEWWPEPDAGNVAMIRAAAEAGEPLDGSMGAQDIYVLIRDLVAATGIKDPAVLAQTLLDHHELSDELKSSLIIDAVRAFAKETLAAGEA